ncbi:NgoFVII restriction endonuclease [Pseudovibrio axinellae]|uniref:NgoFVII restriction endonuclease n=1 Tax=Pseudovibrio axinellae TaxID=989403 RepID=A0A161X7L1_9HYPH|nr:phospholipase D family protein [Pseudovibrio axinellae]KZL04624.1 NgoFVII restriction endonuclease [Pseudovibrio axinellae]SEQ70935.1 HKD family nuclease [Pseudovibrio axinellae]
MKINLLNAETLRGTLPRLICSHDEIQVAVAWGYNGELAKLLMEHSAKFRSVIIGLNGFATCPDLVDRLIDTPNAWVAKATTGIFHPKIYLFRSGSRTEAIVGSANFTSGGLQRNYEACLHIEGSGKEDIFEQLQKELCCYDTLKQRVTSTLSDSYRRQHAAARRRQGTRDPILPNDDKSDKGLVSTLARMGWAEFALEVKRDHYHSFKGRLELLSEIQSLFSGVDKFSDLPVSVWKGIAGTLGRGNEDTSVPGNHDWAWFGSMGGNGDFASLILKQDPKLGAALDCIPREDPVSFENYNNYCESFHRAFVEAGSHHVGNVATATRLLAMKRPDMFVCVNGKNKAGLAKALNFAPSTLSIDNYWERVIVPIQSSPWYNAPRPKTEDSELWDYRVAMLDAIYYDDDA